MYVERLLLKKCKDINLVHNKRLGFDKFFYTNKNIDINKEGTVFDELRANRLNQSYKNNYDKLGETNKISDLKSSVAKSSNMNATIISVGKNLTKMQLLTDRNWDIEDIKKERVTCSANLPKANSNYYQSMKNLITQETQEKNNSNQLQVTNHPQFKCSKNLTSMTLSQNKLKKMNSVKIFAPQKGEYIDTQTAKENLAQRLIYCRLKS